MPAMADGRSSQSQEAKKPSHPLHQIAENPALKLLLKQWLKEEDLIHRRIAVAESRLGAARRDTALLRCSFFLVHSLLLLLLFCSSAPSPSSCRRSWAPCLCSLACSAALLWAARCSADAEAQIERLLERESEDATVLARCVAELKRRGAEFDLMKEVDVLRRAKSLRVEAALGGGARVRRWSGRDVAAVLFLAASGGALGLTRFLLCE